MNSLQAINLLNGLEQSLEDYCELNDEGKEAFRVAVTALELFGNAEQLPSAQPERKKGKWINHRCDDGHHIADCDQCGHSLQWFDDDIPKYCCECGADMREPEDIPMEYFESGGR